VIEGSAKLSLHEGSKMLDFFFCGGGRRNGRRSEGSYPKKEIEIGVLGAEPGGGALNRL